MPKDLDERTAYGAPAVKSPDREVCQYTVYAGLASRVPWQDCGKPAIYVFEDKKYCAGHYRSCMKQVL